MNKRSKKKIKVLVFLGIIFLSSLFVIKGVSLATDSITKTFSKEKVLTEEEKRNQEYKKIEVGVKKDALKYSYDAANIWSMFTPFAQSSTFDEKVVFLTFDGGPSTTVTPQILEILDNNDVKATFFVIGRRLEDEEGKNILKNVYNNGHAIANRSYSNDYNYLYPNRTVNLENVVADFKKTDDLISQSIGQHFTTRTWRLPGGSMSWNGMEPLIKYLKKNNKAVIDWNALNKDAQIGKNAQELYEEAIKPTEKMDIVVLLMHDAYGKEETAKSLDRVIKYYKKEGYIFKTIA